MGGISAIKTGQVAELEAATQYAKMGYEIYFPQMSQSKADFIIVGPDKICKKVQVKKATENPVNGITYLQIRIQGKPTAYSTREYEEGDFDVLVAVHETGMWELPWEVVSDKKSLTFGKIDNGVFISRKRGFTVDEYKIK